MTTVSNPPSEHEHEGESEAFGPYEVYERLGVGGMATVHRAKERGIEGFERTVALKRLLPHLAEDASFVKSFVREAKLASLLRHANIVQLYELGRVGAVYFISMELIEGRDVRRMLRQARRVTGPPPLSVFLSVMSQLCDALDYAHKRTDDKGQPLGIVHRDVSPSNLIVTESGHLKIIDFGIAKAQTEQLRTQTGRIKGKLAYMAPEAIRGHELDARSDVWAAGVIAHELLTARPLFASKNEYQTLMRVQSSDIVPPSKYNESCPSELDDVVLMALAREPGERWQTAAEFRDGLEYVRSQYQVSATPNDVAEWSEWAFSQGGATTSSFDATGSASHTVTPSKLSGPARAFARARSRAAGHTGAIPALDASDVEAAILAEQAADDAAVAQPEPKSQKKEPTDFAFEDSGAGPDESEGHVWGSQPESEEGKPVLLDDIPDVTKVRKQRQQAQPPKQAQAQPPPQAQPPQPRAASAPLRQDTSPPETNPSFGAGIVAQGDDRKRTGLIVAVSVLAACVGVLAYFLVLRSPDKSPAAVEQRAETGILKFRVEPADATISVLGYGKHVGVPYELEVDAPGIYSIEISREGYKTYVSEMEVEAGIKQTLAVGLQVKGGSDKAQVKLESTPAGKKIFLDGQDTGYRTPYVVEMTPGKHMLSLQEDDGSELWQHEFEADLDKQYVFSPSVADLAKRAQLEKEKSAREINGGKRADKSTRHKPTHEDTPTTTEVAAVVAPVTKTSLNTGDSPLGLESIGELPGMNTLPTPAETTKPDEPIKPAKAKVATLTSSQVTKISGTLPSIRVERDSNVNVVVSKLCIGTDGLVKSVTVLTKLPSRPKSDVVRALKRWRYKPYIKDGERTPACFAVNFRVKN